MSKTMKFISGLFFLFSFVFMCVGYAALYDGFNILGELEINPFKFSRFYF